MKTKQFLIIFVASIIIVFQICAQNVAEIEKLLNESVNYSYGKNRQNLNTIEELIRKTQNNSERRQIEQVLAKVLLNEKATIEFKEFICRQLWYLGTSQSVNAVSTLFTNENTVGWACYALTRNPSKDAEVALVNALKIVSLSSRPAVIAALGQRRSELAVDELYKLCNENDNRISDAAIKALDQIGNEQCATYLLKLYESNNSRIKEKSSYALIACANSLSKSGKQSFALDIYNKLFATSSELSIREASLRGIVENSGAKATDFLVKILKSNEANLYTAAIGAINLLKEKQVFKKIADSLDDFPQTVQPPVINMLAEKKEKGLLPVAKKLVDSQNQEIRIASIKALGTIGDESVVGILTKVISKNDQPEKNLAINSLKMLQGTKVDNEIVSHLRKASPPALLDLINIAVDRNITASIPELLKICASKEPDIKKKAFSAIGQLGEPSIIKDVVSIVIKMENDAAQDKAVAAVVSLAEKIKDTKTRSSVVLDQWENAKTDSAKASLLRIAGGIGDETALQFLSKIVQQDDQPKFQEIAIRELAQWQDESAIPVLKGIYQKTKNQTYRTLALRGYVRLLSSATKLNTEDIIKHYEQSLNYSQTPDEKKQILAGLGNVPDEKALALALPLIEDNSVKSEAAQSILQISASIYGSNPNLAKTAINKVLASNIDENLTKQAKIILKQIEANIAYITLWEVAGPYFKEGNNYDALFNIVFPPEEGKTEVNWRPIPAGTNPKQPYIIDLLKFFGGEQRVAYARTYIYSPTDQNARLELGSDDGAKVWLNGELVHSINAARPITPDSDKVNIKLKKGWNSLLLKITQNNLGWEFCVKIVKQDGAPLENLRYATKPN